MTSFKMDDDILKKITSLQVLILFVPFKTIEYIAGFYLICAS